MSLKNVIFNYLPFAFLTYSLFFIYSTSQTINSRYLEEEIETVHERSEHYINHWHTYQPDAACTISFSRDSESFLSEVINTITERACEAFSNFFIGGDYTRSENCNDPSTKDYDHFSDFTRDQRLEQLNDNSNTQNDNDTINNVKAEEIETINEHTPHEETFLVEKIAHISDIKRILTCPKVCARFNEILRKYSFFFRNDFKKKKLQQKLNLLMPYYLDKRGNCSQRLSKEV